MNRNLPYNYKYLEFLNKKNDIENNPSTIYSKNIKIPKIQNNNSVFDTCYKMITRYLCTK